MSEKPQPLRRGTLRLIMYSLGLFAAILLSGCAAVVAYDYIDNPSGKARNQADRAFLSSFRQTQVMREALHMPLLDWCSECYRYDRKWALEDRRCTDRIARYEHGDSTALFPPGYGVPGTETQGFESAKYGPAR